MEEVGGRGYKRLLQTEDGTATTPDLAQINSTINYNPTMNLLARHQPSLEVPQMAQRPLNGVQGHYAADLSLSLRIQSCKYERYRGAASKQTIVRVGESPYDVPRSVGNKTLEDIESEMNKTRELFESGFVPQEEYVRRVQEINEQKRLIESAV